MKSPMKNRGALGLLALMLLSCADQARQGADEAVDEHEYAIVGGGEAWLDSAVAFTTSQCDPAGDNPLICSALLISPTVVLTASHCVRTDVHSPACPNGIDPTQRSTFRVAIGCHNVMTCPEQNWISLAADPVSYPEPLHDIAVLILAQSAMVAPMRLASPARLAEIMSGDLVTEYGWGFTAETGPASDVLKSVARPILTIPFNEPGFTPSPYTFDTANGLNPYIGSHEGDSGGPVLVLRDGEWFALGVIQSGAYDFLRSYHGLVPYYFEWLLRQAGDFAAQSWLPAAQIAAATAPQILG
jgi:hypothetical protein